MQKNSVWIQIHISQKSSYSWSIKHQKKTLSFSFGMTGILNTDGVDAKYTFYLVHSLLVTDAIYKVVWNGVLINCEFHVNFEIIKTNALLNEGVLISA